MEVDLPQALAGPHATVIAGNLGATVIKVEALFFVGAHGGACGVDVVSYNS